MKPGKVVNQSTISEESTPENRFLINLEDLKNEINKSISLLNNKLDSHTESNLHLSYEDKKEIEEYIVSIKKLDEKITQHIEQIKHPSKEDINNWNDKYTKAEIRALLSSVIGNISWDENKYKSYNDLISRNKNPINGMISYVEDEEQFYMYFKSIKKYIRINFNGNPANDTQDGLMSTNDYKKLQSIEEKANYYIHPSDPFTRHITDEQLEEFHKKANNTLATKSKPGLMSAEDKVFIDSMKDNKIQTRTINAYNDSHSINSNSNVIEIDSNSLDKFNHITSNTLVILTDDIYEIDSFDSIVLESLSGVHITSLGFATIISKNEENPIFLLDKCSNCLIDKLNFVNKNTGKGITILGSTNITIDNCRFNNMQYGIELSNSSYCTIENNLLLQVTFGIDILAEDNCSSRNNIIIDNNLTNQIGNNGISIVGYNKSLDEKGIADCSYNIVKDNIINGYNAGIRIVNMNITNNKNLCHVENNIVSENIITRGNGTKNSYGSGNYSILVNSNKNVICNNILNGKEVYESENRNNTIQNNIVCGV